MAAADPVLERDAPLPAGGARGGAGQRLAIAAQLARDGDGAVAWQPAAPVGEAHAQRLAKQQRAEPRAVDEQLARDMDTSRNAVTAALSVRESKSLRVRQPLAEMIVVSSDANVLGCVHLNPQMESLQLDGQDSHSGGLASGARPTEDLEDRDAIQGD